MATAEKDPETEAKPKAEKKPQARVPLRLQKRRDLSDGWVLSPTGATVADAVNTADISNTVNRARLTKKGFRVLTRHNDAERPAAHQSEPPSIEDCAAAIEAIYARKGPVLDALRDELAEAEDTLTGRDINRDDRSFWRTRKKGLEVKIAQIENESVTPEDLYRRLVQEDVSLRAKFVSPEMRASLEAIERERAITEQYGRLDPEEF